MPIYHHLGEIARKRHTALRKEYGGIYHEELLGGEGFSGPSSLLYHIYPPARVRQIKYSRVLDFQPDSDPTLRLRHFRTGSLPGGGGPALDRVPLLFNREVVVLYSNPAQSDQHFYRNAMGDELLFIIEGSGTLFSQLGRLSYGPGDQLIIPRGIMYKLELGEGTHKLLVLETRGLLRPPARYRNAAGQFVEGAPYSERDIRLPRSLDTYDERGEFKLIVKQHHVLNEVILAHHPFDVVGWDGCYYPWAFNIRDFEPRVGQTFMPALASQFLEGEGLTISNLVPRPLAFHPEAIPAPYSHNNVAGDEVMFHANPELPGGRGVGFGSLTLHPAGLVHGPLPGRYEKSLGQARTEELLLRLETTHPLRVAKDALKAEDEGYQFSFLDDE
jgi:homogentisate 1,2-dioxygenase